MIRILRYLKKNQQKMPNTNKRKNESATFQFQDRPEICLIDIAPDTAESLKALGFNCFVGSLGSRVTVPNRERGDQHQVRLNHKLPENLHEYDIFVVDLQNRNKIPYRPEDHESSATTGQNQHLLISSFPETLFDPCPLAT